MSRIGKKLITIPAGVQVALDGNTLRVKGAKGELLLTVHPKLVLDMSEVSGVKTIHLTLKEDLEDKKDNALWGLYGSLVRNMIKGVKDGWEEQLELVGVGFKVAQKGEALELEVGFSHPVKFSVPKGILAKVEKNTITLTGADKQMLGETAARIRSIKPPEPYKGKGIKYIDEVIRRKAGKAAKAGTAAK